jgi:predicted transcriptional regulator YdeE
MLFSIFLYLIKKLLRALDAVKLGNVLIGFKEISKCQENKEQVAGNETYNIKKDFPGWKDCLILEEIKNLKGVQKGKADREKEIIQAILHEWIPESGEEREPEAVLDIA